MASFLVEDRRNWVTIATLGQRVPFIVVAVSTGDDQPWLRPSPDLWRMRRAEAVTISVLSAALFGLVFWAAAGAPAGAISVVVVVALGATVSFFLRRRFRAWRYLERNEDLIV